MLLWRRSDPPSLLSASIWENSAELPMSLVEYRRKRSFDKTKEPEPGKALPKGQRAFRCSCTMPAGGTMTSAFV